MKVLQINSVCGIGSTGRIATDIHNNLVIKGNSSLIAFGRDNPINCECTIRIGKKKDNLTHLIKTRLLDLHGFGSKTATIKFIEEIKEFNPDIIHLHNIHGYYLNVEILFEYLKRTGKPVIWTLHDCWPFTGHCSYFDYNGCKCWELEGTHECIQKKNYPSSILRNNSKKNFFRKKAAFTGLRNLIIVTPSKWLARLVKQSFLRDYPVKVIRNGIDLSVFKPTESSFRERLKIQNKFVILGVASFWEERKGLQYFFDLAKSLNNDEIIVLIGLSDKQKRNLSGNIIALDKTKNINELAEIYTEANVFINPTLEDNYPTTNLEAIACGTPVITFNTGGSPESIDKEVGLVVEKGNLKMLLDEIRCIKDQGKEKFKKNCLRKAHSEFSKEVSFATYLDLYNEVCQ